MIIRGFQGFELPVQYATPSLLYSGHSFLILVLWGRYSLWKENGILLIWFSIQCIVINLEILK